MHCIMLNKSEHFCLNIHSILVGVSPLDVACVRAFLFAKNLHMTLSECVSAKTNGNIQWDREKQKGKPKWKKKNSSSGRQDRRAVEFVLIQQTEFIDTRRPFLHICRLHLWPCVAWKHSLLLSLFIPFRPAFLIWNAHKTATYHLCTLFFERTKNGFALISNFEFFFSPIWGSSSSWALISVMWNDEQPSLHGCHSILYICNILKTECQTQHLRTHAPLSFDGIILSVVEFVIPYLNISQTPLNYPKLYEVMRNIAKVFNRFESVLTLHVIQALLENCSPWMGLICGHF